MSKTVGIKGARARRQEARRRRRVQLLAVVVGSTLVVAASIAYLGSHYGWSNTTAMGRPAPPFVLPDHEGRQVALADYLGRKPVVLVFYMTSG